MYQPVNVSVTTQLTINESLTISIPDNTHVKLDDGPFEYLDVTASVDVAIIYPVCCVVLLEMDAVGDLHYYREEMVVDLEVTVGQQRPSENQGNLLGSDCTNITEFHPFINVSVDSSGSGSVPEVLTFTDTLSESFTFPESLTTVLTIDCFVLATVG